MGVCDWWREGKVAAMLADDVIFLALMRGAVNQILGVESVTSRVLKCEKMFFNCGKSAWTERYKRERGPGPSATAGVPFIFTDVLLGIPAGRDGPCPTTAVLRRISHSFHRGCRIAGRIEWLGRWWVDLDVSGHEADWACFACL